MLKRSVKIISTGSYLPQGEIKAEEIDKELGFPEGTTFKKSGVKRRSMAKGEKATEMAYKAAAVAIERAGIKPNELDAIVCAHAVPEQPIPSNASLLQRHLGLEMSGIPCFDINSTCLSFVTAVDQLSFAIEAGMYKKVLIVSSEVASVGLTWKDHEVISLFGDGAAAAILGKTPENEDSSVLGSVMQTFSAGADFCTIKGGGTGLYATNYNSDNREDYLFHMSGPKVFKLALGQLPEFFDALLDRSEITKDQLDLLIPHQASGRALTLTRRTLRLESEKFYNYIENTGNMVAASIPFGLDKAITEGRIKRGDTIAIAGTSAGLSLGGVILKY